MARITVFGLGEAGSLISADLARAGAEVHGYDPVPVATPEGVNRHDVPEAAAAGADLVLGITSAADGDEALRQALHAIPANAVYADLSTSSPAQERQRATLAADHGLAFADVALMSTVVGKGLSTPQLAAGPGAAAYAELVRPLGAPVELVGEQPGAAAVRKLLRSIFLKGLAALAIEALEAGRAAGLESWLWDHVVDELTDADGRLLERLVRGTGPHAVRRHEEMQATIELLDALGVDAVMTRATVASLSGAITAGVPEPPTTGAHP